MLCLQISTLSSLSEIWGKGGQTCKELSSKGTCELVAITVQDFVMRPLISEGIHCNSVVSIDKLDLHTAVGVIPAGKPAANEVWPGEDPGATLGTHACSMYQAAQVQAEHIKQALAYCSKQLDMH